MLCLCLVQSALLAFNVCPDAPMNDDPCVNSANPPIDLTSTNTHEGTTCCATLDLESLVCGGATQGASVWYTYIPDPMYDGFTIDLESNGAEGPMSIEVFEGTTEEACNGGFEETFAFDCTGNNGILKFGNCFDAGDILFIKVSTNASEDNCGDFTISITPEETEDIADNCLDLANIPVLEPITDIEFQIDYSCVLGSLDFACPEDSTYGGCADFLEVPTVWYRVRTDENAAQLFTNIEPNGVWDPIWSIYSGPDCDNLSIVNFGGSPSCSNDDNTPDLHQVSVFGEEENYWIMVTADPNSIPPGGIVDGSFELCYATTVNAIICLGELEGGACDDESLVMEIIERDNEDLSLEGPFCPGEEVEVNISFFYDASESGADWLSGMIPIFGSGWDLESFDFNANAPTGNGQTAQWYEEGSSVAPIIQENVPILCTYYNEFGVLEICNQLCSPCSECEGQSMQEGDPLPSGYFWVSNGGNAGCDNDGSPGEGWGIGSVTAQIDWTFTIRVKEFDDLVECANKDDLSIGFQTFSDGVTGCWEDPVGECILDRTMFSPAWRIACTEIPPNVVAENAEICSKQETDIAVTMADGSQLTIIVNPIQNPFVTGEEPYVFENGNGVITDFLSNNSPLDQIVQYEIYAVDSTLECNGPKTTIEVLVRTQFIAELEEEICDCEGGCATIGVPSAMGETYLWSSGETTSMIEVCPTEPTTYALTIVDDYGCEKMGTVFVDCQGITELCEEPVFYKLVTDFFIDENENGINDPEDYSYGKGAFFLEPDLAYYYNISAGEDTLLLEKGDYTLNYIQGNLYDQNLTTDSIVDVTLDSVNNCVKVEFGLTPKALIRNIRIQYNLFHLCNSDRTFKMYTINNGTTTESGIMWATLDELLLPSDIATSSEIDTFIAPNTIGWYFDDLLPGSTISRSLDVSIPGPPDVDVGTVVHHTIAVELNNNDGSTIIWKEKEISASILCGYDPNDKAVEPSHEEGYTNIEEEDLVFKIRFQNTGNFPTEDIEIRDTLSEFLDINSVQYIGGSHDEFLTISRVNDRVLLFNYEDIFLPDSTANLAESQGYLIYTVEIKDELPEGTVIENTAHIYFDRNPAVVTNTTKNILYPDLDEDGFYNIEDCDEENPEINPAAEEIPNNDVDEDCDGVALIIDNDMDGFNSDEDCDDEDPAINPDAEEIINNNIDENCDDLVVIIDSDMDGFNSDEDCDDDNASINPNAIEVPNNDVDEDCDGVALIIDEDMDGFNSDVDCDDDNAEINPNAEDIPGNGIDEDCDGEDAILINTVDLFFKAVQIYPNPSNDVFKITLDGNEDIDYVIRNVAGEVIKTGTLAKGNGVVRLGDEANGLYLISLHSIDRNHSSYFKLLKI